MRSGASGADGLGRGGGDVFVAAGALEERDGRHGYRLQGTGYRLQVAEVAEEEVLLCAGGGFVDFG